MEESTVTSKHQITIPKSVREASGIKVGDILIFESRQDELVVRKKEIPKLAEELPLEKPGKLVKDVHEWREIAKRRLVRKQFDETLP